MVLLNKLRQKLLSRKLPSPTADERRLIAELQRRIASLPPLQELDGQSPAARIWMKFQRELRSALLASDPRRFLEFKVIQQTMFIGNPQFTAAEVARLRALPEWNSRWRFALREANSVIVPRSPFYFPSSGTTIHHAFQLHQFEAMTGLDVARFDSVLEFGGGYGSMCRTLNKLGFRGRYFIFDLPEFTALQEFYLQLNNIPICASANATLSGVSCFSDFAQFERLNRHTPPDLFLATWSLSETPLDFRRRVLDTVTARNIFIAYQDEFETIDNCEFFSAWSLKMHQHKWRTIPAAYLPRVNFYLVGTHKDTDNGS
jgi:hypothetical protein